jgi:membrane protein implicated in regulation of membrane protease activity
VSGGGARVGTAALLGVVGIIWVGQGIGLIPGSFMTSDIRWAVAGAVLLVLAAALAWTSRRRP